MRVTQSHAARTSVGTCSRRLGPGCHATMAICLVIFWTSGGLQRKREEEGSRGGGRAQAGGQVAGGRRRPAARSVAMDSQGSSPEQGGEAGHTFSQARCG